MSDNLNEKVQIDRTGLTVNTDPQRDAEKAAAASKEARTPKDGPKGVKIVKR